jgi:hypothetical protein
LEKPPERGLKRRCSAKASIIASSTFKGKHYIIASTTEIKKIMQFFLFYKNICEKNSVRHTACTTYFTMTQSSYRTLEV